MSGKKPFFTGFLLILAAGIVFGAPVLLNTPASGAVSLNASDGPNATVDFKSQQDTNLSNPFPSANSVEWNTSAGNISFSSNGRSQVLVASDNITGTYTNVTQLDVSRNNLTIDPEDKSAVVVGGDADTLAFRDNMQADDSTVDFVYSGTNGHTNLTVQGVTANTQLAAIDKDTNTVLDVATSDGAGNITFRRMPNSQHTVQIQSNSGGPSVDNSTASPQGGTTKTVENVTLEIDVSDPDFPNDNVTANWTVNGSQVSTTYTKSNRTISTTVDRLSEGTHDWNVTVTDSFGETEQSKTFSFEVQHPEPVFSNITPPDGKQLDKDSVTLYADVNDSDFASGQDGDTIDITIEHRPPGGSYSQVDSATLNANGTVKTSLSQLVGGTHDWRVNATDSWGSDTVTTEQSFDIPDKLLIFNESEPNETIKTAEVEVKFFSRSGDIIVKNTSNGEVNMTGLPVTEEFTAVARADNYITRRTYIESIFQQQELYLLNQTTSHNSLVFELDDRTGNYPPDETTIRVQRALTKDFDGDGANETQYATVAGDKFGASNEFATELVGDRTRYRLVVENSDGDRRQLGSYTVTGDDNVVIPIGRLEFSSGELEEGVAMNANLIDHNNSRYIKLKYADPDGVTDNLSYEIVRADNNTKVLQSNTSVAGPLSEFSTTISVPASAPDNVSYEVRWFAERSEGEDQGGTEIAGDVPEVQINDVDPEVLEYISYIGIAAVFGLVVVFDDRLAALAGTATATGLTMLGFVSIPPLALAMGGGISVLYNIGRVRRA